MANPSLQIGNSNWAIKKDNLLGYSTAGTRFLPIPITMTRASAGTRVNSSGLVETVELLGSEQVVNGDFATDSDWGLGTGWTISGGSANSSGSNEDAYLSQSNMVIGKTYKVTFDVNSYTSGALSVRVYGESQQLLVNSTGSYSVLLTPSVTTLLGFRSAGGSGGYVGSIDNVSVKESTRNDLARVDYTGSTSSLLAEPQRTNLVIYSEDFSNAAWSKSSVGIDTSIGTNGINPNIAISPDGTLNSDRVNFLLQSDRDSGMYEIISASTGNSYTTSVYLKGEGSNIGKTIKIRIKRVTGGSFVSVDADYVLTGEWVRLEMNPLTLSGANSNALLVFTSNDATSCLMYGCQVEEGSYPTSIIPTSGSTVTRNQDQYTKTGISDKINTSEGVLFCEFKTPDTSDYSLLSINDGGNVNTVVIGAEGVGGLIFAGARVDGNYAVLYQGGSAYAYNKVAVKYKSGDYAVWVNGTEVITSSSTDISSVDYTNLDFNFGGGSYKFEGKVKQLQVFKTALTDSELIALTT